MRHRDCTRSGASVPKAKLSPSILYDVVENTIKADPTHQMQAQSTSQHMTPRHNNSIVAIVDRFSKMLKLKACKTTIEHGMQRSLRQGHVIDHSNSYNKRVGVIFCVGSCGVAYSAANQSDR